MIMSPLLAFLLAEGTLRALGYGCSVRFLLRTPDGKGYITNEKFGRGFGGVRSQLQPFLFELAAEKPAGTIRICVLGESAAMGTPDPAFGFGPILEQMLKTGYPGTRFEVINAAMRGINSHKIRDIARELSGHAVDVFLVYMGNNEVVGYHGAEPDESKWAQSRLLIKASHWAKSFRVGQFLASGLEPHQPPEQNQAYFREHRLDPDDWRRTLNCENFRANLEDICATAASSGARVALSTVAVNLKDFAPLASVHRAGLTRPEQEQWDCAYKAGQEFENQGLHGPAAQQYRRALEIDAHHAELHFRLARCLYTAGDTTGARAEFALARDLDALQFRADSRLNDIITRVATEYGTKGVALVRTDQAFADCEYGDGGIPGHKLFLDHVHPTFEGNYVMARTFFRQLTSTLAPQLGKAKSDEPLSVKACAAAIAYTEYDDLNVRAAMVRMLGGPPFLDQADHERQQAALEAQIRKRQQAFDAGAAQACLNGYLAALKREPDFWPLRFNLAGLYKDLGRQKDALEQYRWLVQRYPRHKHFHLALAAALRQFGNVEQARAELKAALRLDPADKELRQILR